MQLMTKLPGKENVKEEDLQCDQRCRHEAARKDVSVRGPAGALRLRDGDRFGVSPGSQQQRHEVSLLSPGDGR